MWPRKIYQIKVNAQHERDLPQRSERTSLVHQQGFRFRLPPPIEYVNTERRMNIGSCKTEIYLDTKSVKYTFVTNLPLLGHQRDIQEVY